MTVDIFDKIAVPIASPEDAETTCRVIIREIDEWVGHVVFIYVIEKAGGTPDKASVEQREEYANEIHETIIATLKDTDIVETVQYTADDFDATAIVFTPRGLSRWVRLLTGDIAYSLITEGDRPTVSLSSRKRERFVMSAQGSRKTTDCCPR